MRRPASCSHAAGANALPRDGSAKGPGMVQYGPYRPLGDEITHYWLALGMAKAVGLDLQAEIEAGRFSQEAWADTVQHCRGCTWAWRCPGWMAAHPTIEAAPETCVNAARFNALRAAHAEAAAGERGPAQP